MVKPAPSIRSVLGCIRVAFLLWGIFAIAKSSERLCAEAPATAPGTLPVRGHDEAYWKALENRLGDEDPKIRRTAQKELGRITYRERSVLQSLADHATDIEVQARLSTRIQEIDDELAVDPPPISLHLQNASLTQVAQELQHVTGVTMTVWPPPHAGSPAFNLTASEQPFWGIFTALSVQHGLSVQANNGFILQEQGPGLLHYVQAAAGFVVFPLRLVHSKSSNLQAEPGHEVQSAQLAFSYLLAADPRIHILSYSSPRLTNVVDDKGNVLVNVPSPPPGLDNLLRNYQSQSVFDSTEIFPVPSTTGSRLATVKGEALMQIQLASDQLTVDAPENKIHTPITIGNQILTIQKFNPHDEVIDFSLSLESRQQAHDPFSRGAIPLGIHVEFHDARDHVLWSTEIIGGSGGSISAGDAKPPFKIFLSAPTRAKEVPISFELKDVPIPSIR